MPVRADCAGAEAFVQDAADRSLAVLNAPGADDAQRLAGMSELLFEVADVPLIARLVLGRHWRAASEAQRSAYLDAFRVYALDSLAYRFASLGGGVGFALLGRCVEDGDDALVATEATLSSRPQPVRIDWRVRADGRQISADRRRGRGRQLGREQPQRVQFGGRPPGTRRADRPDPRQVRRPLLADSLSCGRARPDRQALETGL